MKVTDSDVEQGHLVVQWITNRKVLVEMESSLYKLF